MKSSDRSYLLDLNSLISLADPNAMHYEAMQRWFDSEGKRDWGVCPLTESAFVRVTTNPKYGSQGRTVAQATGILAELAKIDGYRYWPITASWAELTAPLAARMKGHQQITNAYLLGLAIREDGVLVTFDASIGYLAGNAFRGNLLTLKV